MLFMVIETFKNGDARAVGERFTERGRMLPAGVAYHSSWIDAGAMRCFQVMEAASPQLLEEWMRQWSDLVEFEVIPIQASAEFWAQLR
jgi:hypothetical protein